MKNYKVSVMLIIKYQHNLCRPQGSWQEDGRLGEEGFDQQGEMPTISRETQSWRFILCYGNNMSTLPRLRLLTQHCRWRRSTSWGKRMGGTVLLAKYMQQKRRTRSELVWHFWLNSSYLCKRTHRVSLSVLFCFLI